MKALFKRSKRQHPPTTKRADGDEINRIMREDAVKPRRSSGEEPHPVIDGWWRATGQIIWIENRRNSRASHSEAAAGASSQARPIRKTSPCFAAPADRRCSRRPVGDVRSTRRLVQIDATLALRIAKRLQERHLRRGQIRMASSWFVVPPDRAVAVALWAT
jgi:hypothetical protein